jgi:tetratricopeptide (TPR) repeat protein
VGLFEGSSQWDYSKAIEYRTQHLAIAKEVGDRAGEGRAYGNLGNEYFLQGDFSKAIKYHGQDLATAKEVGDRAGEGAAYGNLGITHKSQGDFSKAIEHHGQHLAISKEVGDRAGEGMAYANLGTGHLYLNEYERVRQSRRLLRSTTCLGNIAEACTPAVRRSAQNGCRLHVRAGRQGPSSGADHAPGPLSHSSASACLNDRVREAEKWLQTAFDGGDPLQTCTWRTSPSMQAKRTRRCPLCLERRISRSTSP